MPHSSPEAFPLSSLHPHPVDEWPMKLENLKKLHSFLLTFLETSLNLHHPLIAEELDLVSLAINNDRKVLLKVLQLVMLGITNCEKKDIFITRIMKQSQTVQTHLMFFIRNAMEKEEKQTDSDGPKSSVSELAKLKKEKRNLAVKADKSQMQLELLMHSREAYEKQIEELKMRNLDLENELIRRVKMDASQPARDSLVASLEASVTQKDRTIANLQAQLEEERRIAESKIGALRDELDVANEHISRLSNVEATLQKYKKKLEDYSDAKSKLRTVLDENDSLKKQLKSLKEQTESHSAAAKQAASAREELSKAKLKANKLDEALQDRERQLKDLRSTNKDLEEKLQLSDIKCREATEQLDKLLTGDNSSEDSFNPGDESRHGRKNTMEALGFSEMSSDARERRHREIISLTNELAQAKFQKAKIEDELHTVKTTFSGEMARVRAEAAANDNLHAQETVSLNEKVQILESELTATERKQNTEKAELMAKLQYFEMHFKQVDEDLKSMKKEKESLLAESRSLRKDKEDLTSRYLESREQEVKLIRELSERQVKFQAAEAARVQVSQRLDETTSALKLLDGKIQGENEAGKTRAQVVSLERRVMALEAEVVETQVSDR